MMRRTWKTLAALAVLVGAALVGTPAARAGLLPVSQSAVADGGNWRYTYGIVLTTDAHLNPGDFFTVYDFAGFVPGSNIAPAGWTLSVANLSKSTSTVPNDDPNLPNLTWTYNGPVINGQKGLGNFSVDSAIGATKTESFIARTHRDVDGHIDDNITDVTVPINQGSPPPVDNNPEPATLALLGIGLPLAGAVKVLRNRRSAK
jgi:hypothetical protein